MIVELKLNLVWDREVCRVGAGERLMRFADGVKFGHKKAQKAQIISCAFCASCGYSYDLSAEARRRSTDVFNSSGVAGRPCTP
jgi:hypothetical protein